MFLHIPVQNSKFDEAAAKYLCFFETVLAAIVYN